MLIEFSVANYRSLRERQTFSLAKGTGDELAQANTFKAEAARGFDLLRSAALYGANASGKTNFLRAIRAMQQVVRDSARNQQRGDALPVTPFLLSPGTASKPSEFEITFITGNVRYQYGFAATAERIHEEWLFAYPKGRPQRWFARAWNEETKEYQWDLGTKLQGEKQLWQKSTRDNALFLSTAVQLNSRQLQPLFDWFEEALHIMVDARAWSPGFTATLCERAEKPQVLKFLKAADVGIDDIIIEKEVFDPEALPEELPDTVREMITTQMKGKEVYNIKTVHINDEGKPIQFDLETESDGTQKLFAVAGPWIDSLKNGYVVFVDELHDNFHPKLVKFLVELFNNSETNPNNAQLIFTTHETSILSQEVFRRDQVWFCEKERSRGTNLYPLTDFSPRKNRENLELAYLSGRYGGLPYIDSVGSIH